MEKNKEICTKREDGESPYIHMKCDAPTKEKLKLLAKNENRTMSSYLLNLIRKEFSKLKRRGGMDDE